MITIKTENVFGYHNFKDALLAAGYRPYIMGGSDLDESLCGNYARVVGVPDPLHVSIHGKHNLISLEDFKESDKVYTSDTLSRGLISLLNTARKHLTIVETKDHKGRELNLDALLE